jgi:NAD(P)-dependent dehydrogenase (short-subunit alcohol dehydrogenase family)
MKSVIVIVGVGDIGIACARRLGFGHQLLIADFSDARLKSAADALKDVGYDVLTQKTDVADAAQVAALAATCEAAGPLRAVVHTAGLSPTMAPPARIYAVDLLGTALVMDAFLPLTQPGSVGVMITSMAAQLMPTPPELELGLATAPTSQLITLIGDLHKDDSYGAYAVSKRGNQLRVEAAASAWGERGARIVSLSPGLIHTGMGQQEAKANEQITKLRKAVPLDRIGTAEDIASSVEWLIGASASYISGIDLRVDGGVVAAVRWAK